MIEQATVHVPHADRDTNLPVSISLVHLSSCEGLGIVWHHHESSPVLSNSLSTVLVGESCEGQNGENTVADIEDLQRRIDEILSGHGKGNEFIGDAAIAAEATPEQWYSEFYIPRQEITAALISRLMQIADETGGEEGLADTPCRS